MKKELLILGITATLLFSGCSAISVQCNSNQATDRASANTRNAGEDNGLANQGKLQNNQLDNRI